MSASGELTTTDVAELGRLLHRLNDDMDVYRPLLARTTAADPVPPFPGPPGRPRPAEG